MIKGIARECMHKKRKSNVELFRILLILMVIVLHYFNTNMGGVIGHVIPGSINYYCVHLIESFCVVAVNGFVLITGYFSYKKENVKASKVANLVLIMIFWGLLLSLLTVLVLHPESINMQIIKSIIKSATNQWFVIIYCILYLLIPFLNKVINNISQNSYKTLLVIGLIFFYFWPSFYTKITISDGGYGIVNFVYLYFIGAYIRKYHENDKHVLSPLIIYLGCALITTLASLKMGRAWDYNFIFNLIGSVALFEVFRSINIKHNKVINKLATYTFAVYLIDVNSFFNIYLYRTLFHSNNYWNSNSMFLNLIVATIGIYIICIILESLRVLLFGKLFKWLSNKVKLVIEA